MTPNKSLNNLNCQPFTTSKTNLDTELRSIFIALVVNMKLEDLQALKKVVGDMRFIQAASVVASGLNSLKQSQQYMKELHRLDKILEKEISNEPVQP